METTLELWNEMINNAVNISRTTTLYLLPQIINHKKNKTCVNVNSGPGLGQGNTCDGIKSGNEIQSPS
jgi:hypothetical protein